ncbi:MAG: 4-hydroxy-tetrahydrodipicolinate reductase [Candidatus Scalindua sp. AMX11]|nr:MAG: 4-hydroxy-tetrahydrodipicolinate reductase [Candidatus Scalindua sp.]NOG83341.1 4-hydroxy-tetrahydrodipicolinate reductase [Planctomycetota bacterium]RZV76758.1 MAG: 4-hydroxy-tetrahydrodipicolinate reductase [Candidatus Scalindua sp. SCAELEC01]TDE63942.1 MAG: 4-hydroxy-tetrahydrodipicolinate reductase [Candidatus Scalindua sp. AMX11]GJQ60258.1 MAG: 4-hydroxy-tetrahydrodipicolinate reductase [Candidatus Scalindua sp.]
MIKIAINGVCGRMGTRIAELVAKDRGLELVAALEDKNHDNIGKDLGQIVNQDLSGTIISHELQGTPDVLIDFSSPDSTVERLKSCTEQGIAIVIGTTGLDTQQKESVAKASEKVACLFSPNMSIGVNLLFSLVETVSKIMGMDSDIEIVEAHHRFKKDAPSGTALKIAEKICNATNQNMDDITIYGRKGITGERPKNQLCIHSIRSGDIVGEHTVVFGNQGERLELVHKAQSRDSFAIGAIRAATVLAGKPPGQYRMEDVLKELY